LEHLGTVEIGTQKPVMLFKNVLKAEVAFLVSKQHKHKKLFSQETMHASPSKAGVP
jgi:hypothetical protein